MKTTIELTKQEIYSHKLLSDNHGSLVVNERLDYDYLFSKVAEYIWLAGINKLASIIKKI